MNITRNPHAIALFSRLIGAYLESNQSKINNSYNIELLNKCCQWLLEHNPLFAQYDIQPQLCINLLPNTNLFDKDVEVRLLNRLDIVLNLDLYNKRTQDEDYYYFQLLVVFFQDYNRQKIGLVHSNLAIELLLFLVLYPHGHGHWIWPSKENRIQGKNTLLQNIQQKLNSAISYFQEDYYQLGQAYIEIEAIRILQNNQQIVSRRTCQALD